MYGLKKFFAQVVDANGEPIVSGLAVSILSAGAMVATVYDDEIQTALTNPITTTAFGTAKGLIEWWSTETSFDIELVDEDGCYAKVQAFNALDHRIVFDASRKDVQLVYSNTDEGTLLVNSLAVTSFDNGTTINGADLKAGDMLHIMGQLLIIDVHGGSTMTLKVLVGTEEVLTTGAQTLTHDEDTITFDLWVTVNTAGASGKLMTFGRWATDINGTVVSYIKSPTGGAKEVSEDISGTIAVKATGKFSAAEADDEAYLTAFKVVVHHMS